MILIVIAINNIIIYFNGQGNYHPYQRNKI